MKTSEKNKKIGNPTRRIWVRSMIANRGRERKRSTREWRQQRREEKRREERKKEVKKISQGEGP